MDNKLIKPIQGIRIYGANLSLGTIRKLKLEVKKVGDADGWAFAPHYLHRSAERHISGWRGQLRDLLNTGEIIEYHTLKGSRRVLIRNIETGISIVVDLDSKMIVSVWQNKFNDNHKTLDTSSYIFGG